MMSSRKDDLPPGLSSMWRLCKLGYRHEPGMLLASFVISLVAALPDACENVLFTSQIAGNAVLLKSIRNPRVAFRGWSRPS